MSSLFLPGPSCPSRLSLPTFPPVASYAGHSFSACPTVRTDNIATLTSTRHLNDLGFSIPHVSRICHGVSIFPWAVDRHSTQVLPQPATTNSRQQQHQPRFVRSLWPRIAAQLASCRRVLGQRKQTFSDVMSIIRQQAPRSHTRATIR